MHRRLFSSLMILTGLAWLTDPSASAAAGDWMFRRSYYSHDAANSSQDGAYYSHDASPRELDDSPPSRSVYRDPWVGAHPHSAVRSGWRFNSFTIQNGTSTDQTIFRENWYDKDY